MPKKWQVGKPKVDPFVDRAYAKTNGGIIVPSSELPVQKLTPVQKIWQSFKLQYDNAPPAMPRVIVQDDMWWQMKDGTRVRASEMDTRHIYNSLCLLHDKMVPEPYRIKLRSPDFLGSSVTVENDANRMAIKILLVIITKRLQDPARDSEFTDTMLEDLGFMTKNFKELL